MAIKITVSNRAKFNVEGTEKDEDGKDVPFKFGLLCKRLSADELRERTRGDVDMIDFMAEVTESWFDVKDDANKAIDYSEDGLRSLLGRPGLAALTYVTFMRETGAKAKN